MNGNKKIMEKNAGRPKARKGTLGRLIKLFWSDYKVLVIIALT